MRMAIALLVLLLAAVLPHAAVLTAALVLVSLLLGLMRSNARRQDLALLACLLPLPALLLYALHLPRAGEPQLPDPVELWELTDKKQFFGPASLQRVGETLQDHKARLDNSEIAILLDQVRLEPYVSLTILNLNMAPAVWQGRFFSDDYQDLRGQNPRLKLRDGRLFFSRLFPLPSAQQVKGYLVVEVLILSSHSGERAQSWLSTENPDATHYIPVVAASGASSILSRLADGLGLDPLPYDFHFIRERPAPVWLDGYTAAWALLFSVALFSLVRRLTPRRALPILLGVITILCLPTDTPTDFLTSFGSYIFAAPSLGNLLTSPFHFLIAVVTLYLIIYSAIQLEPKARLRSKWVVPFLLLLHFMLSPAFFQRANAFSFVHPLEAIQSPGAFLAYIAFLASFGLAVLLLDRLPYVKLGHKLLFAAAFTPLLWFYPAQISALGSATLIWWFKDLKAPITLKALLATLVFYPFLVLSERQAEINYVRTYLLDEITLLVERNHFRMGRIIQRLPGLATQLDNGPNDQMMEIFAKQAGLFEDEIDFALVLIAPSGQTVSTIEQHISLKEIPLSLGPENRITEYQENPPESPNLLIFRRGLLSGSGQYDFAAVLANDYQNLSLVRRLRRVGEETGLRDQGPITPYFAYTLDVYDQTGKPLYNQAAPTRLGDSELRRIRQNPYFWVADGQNTVFFFKDRSYIYKITHKATPLRMILVRFLALFLATSLIMRAALLARLPGRGWLARWRRSFALKLSGFLFLCSVLPTFMLGYLLINSIQRNQAREEESLARSKILSARDLFEFPLTTARGSANLMPLPSQRNLPTFARLVGEDLSLYASGSLLETNQPELFRKGILDRRLSHGLVEELLLGKQTHVLKRQELSGGATLMVAYTVVSLDEDRDAILSMTMIPFSQRQKFRWWEQLEFSVTVLFGLLFLMAVLTRFFARGFLQPVAAITRGAARMAKGVDHRPIQIQRQDELERMVQAFNTMQTRVRQSQTRLKQQLYVLDETLKSMSSGLLGFDQKGRIILENNKAWTLLNLDQPAPQSLEELVEQCPPLLPLTEMFDRDQAGDVGFNLNPTEENQEILVRLRNVAKGGGHELRSILVIEDVTDAVTASRFKAWSEMARRVAHEIKNPLTPIQLEIDHLVRLYQDGHGQFGEALEDAAQQVGRQVQDLRRIATEFGDYARPLTLEKRVVAMDHLIHNVVDPYQKTMPGVRFELDLAEGLQAEVDDRLLKRAIHNLIVNAIQAMEEQGRLTLKLHQEEGEVVMVVEDTGPGIPPEEQTRIFEAYFSTKDQGTGLGLVIAKRYVSLHDGSLSIDPDYSEGTRFVIRLPNS